MQTQTLTKRQLRAEKIKREVRVENKEDIAIQDANVTRDSVDTAMCMPNPCPLHYIDAPTSEKDWKRMITGDLKLDGIT